MVPMRKQSLDHEWLVLIKVNSAIVAQIVQRSSSATEPTEKSTPARGPRHLTGGKVASFGKSLSKTK